MTKKKPHPGWQGGMDGYLKQNLDMLKKIIKKDWDAICCVDGYEGSGKSVITQQMAKYVDDNFNIDRVCFNSEEFIKQINACPKYGAVVFDEAMTGMSSRAAMSEINKMLMGVLAEIRQKNLFVFIVMPCYFEMDKYAAIWRSRLLIHVYTGKNFERGKFAFYNQDKKKTLYMLGKKFYSYKTPAPNFIGSFPNGYTVPEEEYRQKKLKALKAREDKGDKPSKENLKYIKSMERNQIFIDILNKKYNITLKEIGRVIGITEAGVRAIKKFSTEVLKEQEKDTIDNLKFREDQFNSFKMP